LRRTDLLTSAERSKADAIGRIGHGTNRHLATREQLTKARLSAVVERAVSRARSIQTAVDIPGSTTRLSPVDRTSPPAISLDSMGRKGWKSAGETSHRSGLRRASGVFSSP
jgi:hypothetical protein